MTDQLPVTMGGPEPPRSAPESGEPERIGLGGESTREALPAREPFRSVLRWLGLVEQAAGVVLLGVILALVLIQVGQRYLPGGGWAWTGEVARFAMVWVAFVLAGYLHGHDQHVAIKVVDYVLPVRVLGVVKLLGDVIVAVVSAVGVYATADFMTRDRGQVTAAAEIPLTVIYSVVALGLASTALRAVIAIVVHDLREIRTDAKGAA